jgi:hypothetical protein
MRFTFSLLTLLTSLSLSAQTLHGIVQDSSGHPLGFATILVKGSSRGVTANAEGAYAIHLETGNHVLICEHVGYAREEKSVAITGDMTLNFRLEPQQLSLKDIVIHSGEDPANDIIRHAIQAREAHHKEMSSFSCNVYSKGRASIVTVPNRVFGQKVDIDTSMLGRNNFLYLSETVAQYAEAPPDKQKVVVVSSKVSGQSNAYGLTIPFIVSFYENMVQIGNINPRGFVSPIADGALHYYNFKLIGTWFEDGQMIDKIKVTPKRQYEPCFSGFISIVDGSWRIHSTDLVLGKTAGIQFLDTFHLQQLYAPLDSPIWVITSQVGYFSIKMLGFDGNGSFANTYSDMQLNPVFPKDYFGNTTLKYEKGSNKKPEAYWDTIRPEPLAPAEIRDYYRKDSLEKVQSSPHYQDSVDKVNNRVKVLGLLLTGQTIYHQKSRETITFSPLVTSVGFNTVEGWFLHEDLTYKKGLGKPEDQSYFSLNPGARYGFSNRHFNGWLNGSYRFKGKYNSMLEAGGGRNIYQYDNRGPISAALNTIYTLFNVENNMKIYEASFGRAAFIHTLGKSGLTFKIEGDWQNRVALANTDTTTYFVKAKGRTGFTTNNPTALTGNVPMAPNKASSLMLDLTWQPGLKYIEYPESLVSLGTKYPTLELTYVKGLDGVLGSSANYDKWAFTVKDDINLKLGGLFRYNLGIGGFLNSKSVAVPDYNQFNGNQIGFAATYMRYYQLAPYYLYSNTDPFYFSGFVEHHFNGLLTNKIPGLRELNWNLVGACNYLYLSDGRQYVEASIGLENILKILRFDFVWGWPDDGAHLTGVRLGATLGQ